MSNSSQINSSTLQPQFPTVIDETQAIQTTGASPKAKDLTTIQASPTTIRLISRFMSAQETGVDHVFWEILKYLPLSALRTLRLVNTTLKNLVKRDSSDLVYIRLNTSELSDPDNEKCTFAKNNELCIKIDIETAQDLQDWIDFVQREENSVIQQRIKLTCVLTCDDLSDSENIKFKFVQDYNCKIKINLTPATPIKIQNCIDYIKKSDNTFFLHLIETIHFIEINSINETPVQNLIKLLPSKCPNLTNFIVGCIKDNVILIFPDEFNILETFCCGNIADATVLTFPKEMHNLVNFFCGDIEPNLLLTLPRKLSKLKSVTLGTVKNDKTQELLKAFQDLTQRPYPFTSLELSNPQAQNFSS